MIPRCPPRRCTLPEREFDLSGETFRQIADLACSEAGIVLTDAKEPLVYARLAKRLRLLSLGSFAEYLGLLAESHSERAEFISTLTTNTTQFFREAHHFDTLADTVLPPLIETARRGGRVRLWSAGCSSGEEPFSLAMTLLLLCRDVAALDVKILATDVDRQILDRAEAGRYPAQSLATLPAGVQAWFGAADPEGRRAIDPTVRGLVTFRQMNLVRPWPVNGPFDAILCRNVVIYFAPETQDRIWHGFVSTLKPGGHLFIGHSERLSPSVKNEFETIGMTTFRLRGRGEDRPGEGDTGCR